MVLKYFLNKIKLLRGKDYYALKRYARDHLGNEIYAKDHDNNEIYLNIGDDNEINEIFAKKDNKIYYAKNNRGNFILPVRNGKPYYFFENGQPIFPVNKQNLPVYAQYNNFEIYPNDGTTDIYLTDSDGNQCYAKDVLNNQFYYASKWLKNHQVQFYAKDKDNKDIFIYDKNGDVVYLVNISLNKPIYTLIKNKEIYMKSGKREVYGRNLKKLPVYAKNGDNEYFATDENTLPFYANYENVQFYPKMKDKKQFYRKIEGKELYASLDKNKQYYAKNETLDDMMAKDKNNLAYYCTKSDVEIYPKMKNDDQFYKINEKNVETPALNEFQLQYYAQKHTGELFYPMDFSLQID